MSMCDVLLGKARTADNPGGMWLAAPQQLRRVQALKLQVRAGGGADLRQLTCSVCFDDYPALQGVECCPAADAAGPANAPMPEKHFVCDECFEGHVASATDFESLELFQRRGGVVCVYPGCTAPPFTDAVLAKVRLGLGLGLGFP